jgi:succinoglycan biosynthesis protein ExoO
MKVSVLIAAYNVAGCISRALASVQAQSYGDWEAIVVDDASGDETVVVVAALASNEPRISLLRHEQNCGPGAARNTALAAARGEWIAVLDADDAWRPERLECMLAAAARTGAEFIADNQIFFDGELQQEVSVVLDPPADINPLTFKMLFSGEHQDSAKDLGLLKPLIRRRAILDHNIRYDESLRYGEDLHFYAQLLIMGVRAVLLAEAYYIYTNQTGFLSERRSRFSYTVKSAGSLLRVVDGLITRFEHVLTPQARLEIMIFRKRMEGRQRIQRITTLRCAHHHGRLTLFLIRHPLTAWRYLVTSRTFRRWVAPRRVGTGRGGVPTRPVSNGMSSR